jgi:hypothetical protein
MIGDGSMTTATPTRFPFYIPSRGRPGRQTTARRLAKYGIVPSIIVEDAEHDAYAAANPDNPILVWPQRYMDEYERTPGLDPHPTTGAAHNFAWDHARELGYSHHWIMDDNLTHFHYRTPQGRVKEPRDSTPFLWHEQLMCRYVNLAGFSLGLGHTFGDLPFRLNTRLYCSVLYRNDLNESGITWRRGLNDDTIVSLDILKTRYWCTAESHLLLGYKTPTSRTKRMPGGMTDFYADGGFIRKAAEAIRVHPDCVRMVNRYGRVHHQLDYSQFTQTLIPVESDGLQGA